MDKAGGQKRVFNACQCKDPGASNKKKARAPSRRRRVPKTDKNRNLQMKIHNNNSNYGIADTSVLPLLPVRNASSNESVVYLGTFGNNICCSIIDWTASSPACLVINQEDNHSNRRLLPISATSINNKFQEPRQHFYPPLILHQGGDCHQGFRLLRPDSFSFASEPRESSGPIRRHRPKPPQPPPPPPKKDSCDLEPGCLCTVLNKMPLDLSFSVNEDTVLEQVLDIKQDLVPLFKNLKVTDLVEFLKMPFNVESLMEMYRVNVTDSFCY